MAKTGKAARGRCPLSKASWLAPAVGRGAPRGARGAETGSYHLASLNRDSNFLLHGRPSQVLVQAVLVIVSVVVESTAQGSVADRVRA